MWQAIQQILAHPMMTGIQTIVSIVALMVALRVDRDKIFPNGGIRVQGASIFLRSIMAYRPSPRAAFAWGVSFLAVFLFAISALLLRPAARSGLSPTPGARAALVAGSFSSTSSPQPGPHQSAAPPASAVRALPSPAAPASTPQTAVTPPGSAPSAPVGRAATASGIKPVTAPGTGELSVQARTAGCNALDYDVQMNGTLTGSGRVGEKMRLAAGTYTITLKTRFGQPPIRSGVVVEAGRPTTVDFSAEVGALRVSGYPTIGGPAIEIGGSKGLASDWDQCGPAGAYEVAVEEYSYDCWRGQWSCEPVSTALFPPAVDVKLPVEVKAGERSVVEPAALPYQLGLVRFAPGVEVGEVRVRELRSDVEFADSLPNRSSGFWMVAGRYRLSLIRQPYTGVQYEFEIRPGHTTVLELP